MQSILNRNDRAKPRRRWWRLFTQFSLRTLLILVTAWACACWWWLQPGSRDEQLAGNRLKLRRQVRTVVDHLAATANPAPGSKPEPILENAGAWRLFDEHGDLLAAGRYDKDAAEGTWTLYHANGRKAATGRMVGGQRTGLWRTWDADGRPVSEVTYRAAQRKQPRPVQPHLPVAASLGSAAPTGPGTPLLQFGFCCSGLYSNPRYFSPPPEGGLRHGPARGWHPTGAPSFEGGYRDDLRSGPWKTYDEQGRQIESGEFLANQRHGVWTIRDPATGGEQTAEYVAGLPRSVHEQLVSQLREDLANGEIRRQVAAARRLEELGPGGLPLLWESLDHPSDDVKLLALRGLVELRAFDDPALPARVRDELEVLADYDDPRLAIRALLAIFLTQPLRRDECFTRLVPRLAQLPERNDLALETMLCVFRTDDERQTDALRIILQRLGSRPFPIQASDEVSVAIPAELVEIGQPLIPLLGASFDAYNADTRLAAVCLLRDMVAAGDTELVQVGPNQWERHWPIPAAAQNLVARAKVDRDARVKAAAEHIGREEIGGRGGFGCGGHFGAASTSGNWAGF